jgi:uncharacterized membrane protein HdeD (DUF308 family)
MVDVKIKLSGLWVAHMLSTTYADVLRLYDPGEVVASFPMTHELMLVSSITMVIPIVMVFLSLTLKDKANRWANIIAGIFWVGYDLLMVISSMASPAYEMFFGIVYLMFAALIVWHAWKWPKQEG